MVELVICCLLLFLVILLIAFHDLHMKYKDLYTDFSRHQLETEKRFIAFADAITAHIASEYTARKK